MKILYTLIILTFSLTTFSQTKLDTAVFNEVNKYRVSLHLNEVKWDTTCFKCSNKHTSYLLRKNKSAWPNLIVGHSEDTLVSLRDRYFYYLGKKSTDHFEHYIGEVVIGGDFYRFDIQKVAIELVNGWKKSKEHNKILIDKDFKLAATSVQFFSTYTNIRNNYSHRVISTMVFSIGKKTEKQKIITEKISKQSFIKRTYNRIF